MLVGTLAGGPTPLPATLDYRALRQRLWREGWFAPSASYYGMKAAAIAAFAAAGTVALLACGHWAARVGLGGLLWGLAIHQAAFMAHDASHRGIAAPRPGGGFNREAWCVAGRLRSQPSSRITLYSPPYTTLYSPYNLHPIHLIHLTTGSLVTSASACPTRCGGRSTPSTMR
jgi:hypothetical protein